MPASVVVSHRHTFPNFRVGAIICSNGKLDYHIEGAFDGHVCTDQKVFAKPCCGMDDEFSLGCILGISLAESLNMIVYFWRGDEMDLLWSSGRQGMAVC